MGSPPPLFGVPAGVSFEGAGNPAPSSSTPAVTLPPTKKTKQCAKGKHRSRGRCVKAKAKAKGVAKRKGKK